MLVFTPPEPSHLPGAVHAILLIAGD